MSERPNAPLPPPVPPEDAGKLVGAWTAGTLSDAERKALHHAALDNQALFDQLADEEGLRELFADPATRAELAGLLDDDKPGAAAQSGSVALPLLARSRADAAAAMAPAPSASPASRVAAAENVSWWRSIFRPAPMAAFSAGAVAVLAFVMLRPSVVMKAPAEGEQAAVIAESNAAKRPGDAAPSATSINNAQPPPLQQQPQQQPPARQIAKDTEHRDELLAVPAAPPRRSDTLAESKPKREAPVPQVSEAGPATGVAPAISVDAPSAPAPPPPVAFAPPPAPPSPPAAAAEAERARGPEDKRRASLAKAAAPPPSPAPPPPLRYRIEREQAAGEWVEFGGELSRGERARVAVTAAAKGVVTILSNGATLAVEVNPGQTIHFPGSGSLPSEAGEREVAILFEPGRIAPAAAPPLQRLYQQPQPGSVGGSGLGRSKKANQAPPPAQADRQSQTADTAANTTATPGSANSAMTLTIRLRYR